MSFSNSEIILQSLWHSYTARWSIKESFRLLGKSVKSAPSTKMGEKDFVEHYRPISLLCCVSKVFERIIFETLYENLRHKLHPAQYGFRQKRSATLQLLTFLHKIYTNYDDEAVKELGVIISILQKHSTQFDMTY